MLKQFNTCLGNLRPRPVCEDWFRKYIKIIWAANKFKAHHAYCIQEKKNPNHFTFRANTERLWIHWIYYCSNFREGFMIEKFMFYDHNLVLIYLYNGDFIAITFYFSWNKNMLAISVKWWLPRQMKSQF